MKATKLIKKTIKDFYNLNENEYEVQIQARMLGDSKHTTYDVAVIYHENHYYVIRAWQYGGRKIRPVRPDETLKEAFNKYLELYE